MCSDVEDGEVSSSTISNDETISPSEMLSSTLQVKVKIEHNGSLEPPDNQEHPEGVVVTPSPMKKVKTDTNTMIAMIFLPNLAVVDMIRITLVSLNWTMT